MYERKKKKKCDYCGEWFKTLYPSKLWAGSYYDFCRSRCAENYKFDKFNIAQKLFKSLDDCKDLLQAFNGKFKCDFEQFDDSRDLRNNDIIDLLNHFNFKDLNDAAFKHILKNSGAYKPADFQNILNEKLKEKIITALGTLNLL